MMDPKLPKLDKKREPRRRILEGGNGLNPFEGLDPWGAETDVERRDAEGRTVEADDDGEGEAGDEGATGARPPAAGVRSGNHQFEVCVLALLESRVDHHLTVHAGYTYLTHRTLKRNIRASKSRTCCESCDRLRYVDSVRRIHGDVDESLCVIVGREEGTKGAVNQTCNQNLIIRCFAFAAGKTAREASCGRKFLFVLYGQRHKISAGNRIFCGADSGENHRVAEGCHHSAIGLFGQLACLQFDHSSIGKSDFFGNNIHLKFVINSRRLRPC